jgi:L-asparaginase II
MNSPGLLVEEYRNKILECAHYGHLAIVSPEGVFYSVGNCVQTVFYRSASKPIQALPLIRLGLDRKYGLTEKELAILSGSHRCELEHIEVIESLLQKTGIREEQLIMLPVYPLDPLTKEYMLNRNMDPRKIYHNCVGKHIACILLQRESGQPEEDYWKPESTVQQTILDCISEISAYPRELIGTGTDGCGVPVYALPLRFMANAFLRLACPDLIEDPELRTAATRNASLMNKYPRMISGNGAICSLLCADDNIVAKGGALGVYCFGLRRERLGVAYKISDGSYDELPLIAVSILEQLGYSGTDTIDRLRDRFPKTIRNDCGVEVGEYLPVFRLSK